MFLYTLQSFSIYNNKKNCFYNAEATNANLLNTVCKQQTVGYFKETPTERGRTPKKQLFHDSDRRRAIVTMFRQQMCDIDNIAPIALLPLTKMPQTLAFKQKSYLMPPEKNYHFSPFNMLKKSFPLALCHPF